MIGNEMSTVSGWQAMKEQASVLIASGFLPASIKTPQQALSIALAGRELGIGFMESIRGINVIQGKPTVTPQLMLALAYRTKEVESVKIDSTNERSIVTIKRRGSPPHSYEFGAKEAQALGLMNKDNYQKQPKVMYQWRAIAGNLRVTFPDAVSGLYTPEELGATVVVGENESMEIAEAPKTQEFTRQNIETEGQGIRHNIDSQHKSNDVISASIKAVVNKDAKAVEPMTMVSEITDWLGLMNNGDPELMDEQLKVMTIYNSKKAGEEGKQKWLKVSDLPSIATKLPNWLKSTHAKVGDIYNKWVSVAESQ